MSIDAAAAAGGESTGPTVQCQLEDTASDEPDKPLTTL